MANSFEKIKTFLAIVMVNCQTKKPFKMADATRAANITSNAGTIIKRLGMVERGKSNEDGTRIWVWVSPHGLGQINDLAASLMAALKVYQDSFIKPPAPKEAQIEPPLLPFSGTDTSLDVTIKSHPEDLNIIHEDSEGWDLPQVYPSPSFQKTVLFFLKDLMQRVDELDNKVSKLNEDIAACRKWCES